MADSENCWAKIRSEINEDKMGALSQEEQSAIGDLADELFKSGVSKDRIEKRLNSYISNILKSKESDRIQLINNKYKEVNAMNRAMEWKSGPHVGYEAFIGGNETEVARGNAYSLESKKHAIEMDLLKPFNAEMYNQDLFGAFHSRDPATRKAIFKESYDVKISKESTSGNPIARKIAEEYKKLDDAGLEYRRAAGLDINENKTYGMGYHWDAIKVSGRRWNNRDAMRESFMSDLIQHGDKEKIFGEFMDSPEHQRTWATKYVDRIEQGKYGIMNEFDRSDIQERLLYSRTWVPKDSDSYAYMVDKYTRMTPGGAIYGHVSSIARDIVAFQNYGSDAVQGAKNIRNMIGRKLKASGEMKKFKAWESNKNYLDSLEKAFFGFSGHTGVSLGARSVKAARDLQVMHLLGNVRLAHLLNVANSAALIKSTTDGGNIVSPIYNAIQKSWKLMKEEERVRMANKLGMMVTIDQGQFFDRTLSADWGLLGAGKISGLASDMMRILGIQEWTDAQRIQHGWSLAEDLHFQSNKTWDQLGKTGRTMNRYEFEPHEWNDVVRNAKEEAAGFKIVSAESLDNLPNSVYSDSIKKNNLDLTIKEYRQQIKFKYLAMMDTEARLATQTPGIREQAILLRGTHADDPGGMLLRLTAFLHSIPLKQLQVNRRVALSDGNARTMGDFWHGQGNMKGMMHLCTYLLVGGYLVNTLRDLALGREPKSPFSRDTILRAMVRGGMGGLYADMALGGHYKFGGDVLASVLGPTISNAADLIAEASKIGSLTFDGDKDMETKMRETLKGLSKMVGGQMPLSNAIVVKPIMDYLFLYHLQEQLNPGHLQRYSNNYQKDKGIVNDRRAWLFRGLEPTYHENEAGYQRLLRGTF